MLKITFITIGDLPKGTWGKIGDEFSIRLKKFANITKIHAKNPEAAIKSVPKHNILIILDAQGVQHTSETFAKFLQKHENLGDHVTFLLGGPHGFSESIKQLAHIRLSLSPMTTTRDLAHLFFLEQLYRACTINKNITYHY